MTYLDVDRRELAMPPAPRDRTIAAGMHLGTIFAPVVAPLLVMIACRGSAFACAHARRSLRETIVLQLALLLVGAASLGYSLWSLYGHYQSGWRDFSIWPIVAKAAIGWALLAVLEFFNTIAAVRQAWRAYSGEWPKAAKRSG